MYVIILSVWRLIRLMGTGPVKTTPQKLNYGSLKVQGTILAATGIIVRIIGLAYRIPLVRIIGNEGMGYYSVAFELFTTLLLISSYSLPTAVSKMISAKIAGNDYVKADQILKISLLYATFAGCLGCLFMALGAEWLADSFFKLPFCKYALISLAPAIWVLAYVGVLRGFFQGMSTMVPTAVSQITEQIVNAAVSIFASWRFCSSVLKTAPGQSEVSAWGAFGGAIGTGTGALAAFIILLILFIKKRPEWQAHINNSKSLGFAAGSRHDLSKALILTVVPLMLSNAIINLDGIVDAGIFSSTMVSRLDMDASSVAADFSIFSSRFKILANIPCAIASSFSSSIIVAMSRRSAAGGTHDLQRPVTDALKYTVLIALPSAVGLAVLGDPVTTLLFGKNELAAAMCIIGAPGVLLHPLVTVSFSVLEGNGYMKTPVVILSADMILHALLLTASLRIFGLGICGVLLAYDFSGLFSYSLNMICLKRKLGYKSEYKATYIKPLICSAVMGVTGYFCLKAVRMFTSSDLLITVICMAASGLVYAVMLVITGTVTKEELKDLPVIRRFIR